MDQTRSNQPTFTIITPLYNHSRYVAEALRSVMAQTFRDWEQIVVDDGSTDGGGRIVEQLARQDGRIVLIRQANAGAAAARNAALARSAGEWIAFLDSDDLWFPSALADYHRYIQAHPQARFIYGRRHRLNEDGSVTELPGMHQDRPSGTADLFRKMYLSTLCCCFRRELLDETGPFDPALPCCEDYELFLRISLRCRFEPMGRPTGLRRRHGANISRQTGFTRMVEAEVLRRFVERLGGRDVLEAALVRNRLGQLYYASARQYFKARCFGQALQAAKLAGRYRPCLKAAAIRTTSRCLLPFGRTDAREMPKL